MTSNTPKGISSAGTPLPSSFDGNSEFYEENRWQKFSRRLTEEPLIPLGCLLTCMALFGATRSIRAGDHNRTQRMFRARIAAQGFTLVAMVAGSVYWQSDRDKRKEFDGVVAERKAKEKNEAWIRELEARDEEEKEIKAMRDARRRGVEYIRKEKVDGVKKEVEKMVKDVKEEKVKPAENKVQEKVAEGEKEAKSVMENVRQMLGGKKS
ncbi:Respiratory supercomplex factor [Hyphodiscus hymeniophilus]|uniref:Respiratory supercomplex factor n=1 Tax=Hyphodiscus hymeniophilus TaxID=353542 RepID=A0A9P6SN92_9HELO|nr:Respiratory supercomplex factor [Hyphodiscus hymeniophilus]